MYLAPNGKEGHHYTAEEVYEMLSKSTKSKARKKTVSGGFEDGRAQKEERETEQNSSRIWDDHTHWSEYEEDDEMRDVWIKRF